MVSTLSRRSLLGCACCAPMAASLALGASALTPAHAAGKTTDLTADQALQRLKDGNRKFMADAPDQTAAAAQMDNPRLNHERRLEMAQGQTPFAVLVSCSDSRVPPELLFGRGLGECSSSATLETRSTRWRLAASSTPLLSWACRSFLCWGTSAAAPWMPPCRLWKRMPPSPAASARSSSRSSRPPCAKNAAPANADREQVLDMAVRENVKRTVTRLRSASEPILMDPLKGGKRRSLGPATISMMAVSISSWRADCSLGQARCLRDPFIRVFVRLASTRPTTSGACRRRSMRSGRLWPLP